MSTLFSIHARTLTGLEEPLAEELRALGAQDVVCGSRVVFCKGSLETLYKANLWSRTAIRVLRPLASFPALDEKAFYDAVRKVDWSPWIKADGLLAVDAHVRSSFTTHSLFLAQLAKDAVVDQFRDKTGVRPSVDLENPDLRIVVSLFKNEGQIYVDSSGDSLHRRGYRRKAGDAPISETLAAGIVVLSKWDPTTPLLDPMCGSGTFGIEAAMKVRNIAPGLLRERFGFQSWADYDRELHTRLVTEARAAVRKDATATIVGIEIDGVVAQIARENAVRAGVPDLVKIENANFFEWDGRFEKPGTILLNPPYDERLPVDNVAVLYQKIGDRLLQSYPGWTAHMLSGNLEAVQYVGLKPSRKTVLFNGAIECRLFQYELRADVEAAERRMARRQAPPEINPRWKEKADMLANRLRKNLKHLGRWAKRESISCWRVYDWDVPELAFMIDIFGDRMHFAEVERNHDHSPIEHTKYMQLMVDTAASVLGIAPDKVYFKKRKPQKKAQEGGGFQYAPHDETGEFVEVDEGGHRFLVNLADYLDVGLFLDHRKTRSIVESEAKGRDFLNLFAYTGSFSVYAAAGGARSTTTVDTSKTYLEWAGKNLSLNGFKGPQHQGVRSDALEFLERSRETFDLAVVDPPTRSVNRSSGRVFDVQEDHVPLLRAVFNRMRKGGKVYFSTNYRTFNLDEAGLKAVNAGVKIEEITSHTIPLDFERKPSHRCWRIQL